MRYRRAQVSGGTYFFTVNLANRTSSLLTEQIAALREAVRYVRQRYPFHIVAWVVLPEHMHAIWTLPEEDADYSTRWRLIKQRFSKAMEPQNTVGISRERKGEREIWQRRFWEHQIRDEKDLQSHVDYIHINPVKHGHVQTASAWPYSSIHRYIREEIIPPDWASDSNLAIPSGERHPSP